MEPKFVKIEDRYINLTLVDVIADSPAMGTISIYTVGDDDGLILRGDERQRFLAALDKIGYYAA